MKQNDYVLCGECKYKEPIVHEQYESLVPFTCSQCGSHFVDQNSPVIPPERIEDQADLDFFLP